MNFSARFDDGWRDKFNQNNLHSAMKCHQCERPALYDAGGSNGVNLCLNCYEKFSRIKYLDFLENAARTNQALDDMDAISGFISPGGRISVVDLARAIQRSAIYNNFNVNNSQIGVLNTGDIAKIDAAITLSKGSDLENFGDTLKIFTQEIVNSTSISIEQKQEIIDLLQVLANQALTNKRPSVIWPLAKAIQEKVALVAGLSQSADKLISAIKDLFV